MPDIEGCLQQVMAIRGALGASLVDVPSGLTMGAVGRDLSGSAETVGMGTARLVQASVDTAAYATVGRPARLEDVVITADNGYHLLHFPVIDAGGRLVLYVWLDRVAGNLAMTQRSLRGIGTQLSAS